MSVIMFDYFREFDRDTLMRLSDAGCEYVLLLDRWHLTEPARGDLRIEPLLNYAQDCRQAGIQLFLQTPVGVPLWSPPDWFLVNAEGQRSDFLEPLSGLELPDGTEGYEIAIAIGLRMWSYWNDEAEDYLGQYVRTIRSAMQTEAAVCIGSIGACGEYFFPSNYFYGFLGRNNSPWWHDSKAEASWSAFQQTHPAAHRNEWWGAKAREIAHRRLGLYEHRWLQFVPYFSGWGHFGNDTVDQILVAERAGLRTILFTVFKPEYIETAAKQAAQVPTWGGAEGAANVVATSHKAHEMGLAGVVCGPLWYDYGRVWQPWMFDRIREANAFWKGVCTPATVLPLNNSAL